MTRMSVTGYGTTRDEALAFAEDLAAGHFGIGVRTVRTARARVEARDRAGRPVLWSVTCDYTATPSTRPTGTVEPLIGGMRLTAAADAVRGLRSSP